ncbi:MAG: hypothetical protein ACI4EG_08600 [Fusicatenibacter sp.]
MKDEKRKALEWMRELPSLPIPAYEEKNRRFVDAVEDPQNGIYRKNPENGHPIFGAYTRSKSNEMVTWGILSVGQWLMNRESSWIAPTYFDFYSNEFQIFLNSPGDQKTEYWYLFYVNLLAGAVYKTLYENDERARFCMVQSERSMRRIAKAINYDFNAQGFDFCKNRSFTNREIYRQPDSLAGYAYQMLYAHQVLKEPGFLEESIKAIKKYQEFSVNPWYEIPNGSAGLYAAAWLNAHGYSNDVEKTALWVFDSEGGPLQRGFWGKECVNGLMMGWRGESRKDAEDSAYSMESLMPIQLLLPSLRYAPSLAPMVSDWVRHVLSSFQLFYGRGKMKLDETRPGEFTAIPYERLQRIEGKEEPIACGDYDGHRSVYGAGYLMWLETLVRMTDREWIFALDVSITDWMCDRSCPVYMIQNPQETAQTVTFTPADLWKKRRADLFEETFHVWDVNSAQYIGEFRNRITVTVLPGEIKTIVIDQKAPVQTDTFICGSNGEELLNTGG